MSLLQAPHSQRHLATAAASQLRALSLFTFSTSLRAVESGSSNARSTGVQRRLFHWAAHGGYGLAVKLLAPSHGREVVKVRVQGQLGVALWGTGHAGSSWQMG